MSLYSRMNESNRVYRRQVRKHVAFLLCKPTVLFRPLYNPYWVLRESVVCDADNKGGSSQTRSSVRFTPQKTERTLFLPIAKTTNQALSDQTQNDVRRSRHGLIPEPWSEADLPLP